MTTAPGLDVVLPGARQSSPTRHPEGSSELEVKGRGCRFTFAIAVLGAAVLWVSAHSAVARQPTDPTGTPGVVRAGAAKSTLRLPSGVPLAGYGSVARRLWIPDVLHRHPHAFWFSPSTGTRDPVMARALVVQGQAVSVLWVSVDLVGVDGEFSRDLRDRLRARGLQFSAVIVSASHTHSGPGAFLDSNVFGFVATDRFDPDVRQALLEGIATTAAAATTGAIEARVGSGIVTAPSLTASRLDLPLDEQLVVLKVVGRDDRAIAAVWNYAIHGTMLGPTNRRLSGDVMGAASAEIEHRLGVPALFINGAVGDVSPRFHGARALVGVARALAQHVVREWPRIRPQADVELTIAQEAVGLPAPFLSLRNCLGRWVPRPLTLPLTAVLPQSAELTAVGLGRTTWVTVPGELQTALGLEVKAAAARSSRSGVVAGLSNGYLGYFLTRAAYRRDASYTACSSLYGEAAGEQLTATAKRLVERLGAPAEPNSADARRSRGNPKRALPRPAGTAPTGPSAGHRRHAPSSHVRPTATRRAEWRATGR